MIVCGECHADLVTIEHQGPAQVPEIFAQLAEIPGERYWTWECPTHGVKGFRLDGGMLDLGVLRAEAGPSDFFIEGPLP